MEHSPWEDQRPELMGVECEVNDDTEVAILETTSNVRPPPFLCVPPPMLGIVGAINTSDGSHQEINVDLGFVDRAFPDVMLGISWERTKQPLIPKAVEEPIHGCY